MRISGWLGDESRAMRAHDRRPHCVRFRDPGNGTGNADEVESRVSGERRHRDHCEPQEFEAVDGAMRPVLPTPNKQTRPRPGRRRRRDVSGVWKARRRPVEGRLERCGCQSGRREPGETRATFPRAAGRRKDAQGGGRKATARGGRSVNAGDASWGMARSAGGDARQVEDARESSRRARLENADGADACSRQEERRRRERRETQAGEALKSACAAASHALALLLTPSQSGLAPVRDAPPRRPATASLRRYSGRPL